MNKIQPGLNGHAVMIGYKHDRLYGWVEKDKTWKKLGGRVKSVASGRGGRLYKTVFNSNRVYQQTRSNKIEECLKKQKQVKKMLEKAKIDKDREQLETISAELKVKIQ